MGARTPEELETLFEDALVLGDRAVLASLFAESAVLAVNDESPVRGDAIVRLALARWGGHAYVADPRRVFTTRDVALVVADHGVNVARRGRNGIWKYAIVHQAVGGGGARDGEEMEPWSSR